jgi:hypothetical protein
MTGAVAGVTVAVVTGMVAGEPLPAMFDGPRLLDRDGRVLAELAPDGHWYSEQGLPCLGLTVQLEQPAKGTKLSEEDKRTDAAWMRHANEVIVRVAEAQELFTSDDLWAGLQSDPRESRMIGNALSSARSVGVIAPTHDHRPSGRRENHGRPVRVWRSLRYTAAS